MPKVKEIKSGDYKMKLPRYFSIQEIVRMISNFYKKYPLLKENKNLTKNIW